MFYEEQAGSVQQIASRAFLRHGARRRRLDESEERYSASDIQTIYCELAEASPLM